MLKLEKIKPTTGIQTDVSPKAIEQGGSRMVVNPIIIAENCRYISSDDGREFIFESVRGNIKVSNPDIPVSGTNLQIGSFEDLQHNTLIFFLYNSGGEHGIYKYDPLAGTITTLIKNSLLNFQNDPRYLITGIGIQDDLLYWSDGFNPQRVINMTRNYSGMLSEKSINLLKEQPTSRPLLSSEPKGHPDFRFSDPTVPTNKIADKNLQFSYQYIFIDNEKSVIAPFSTLSYADKNPLDTINTSLRNVVLFSISIPTDVLPFVKQLNVLVREGNEGTWNIFSKFTQLSATVLVGYTGYESLEALSDSESVKIQEAIPTISKSLTVHRNRLIVSSDEEGFDVNLSSGVFPITITANQILETYTSNTRNTYFKRGGSRTFGIALFDSLGRSMGVFGKTNIKFTPADDQNNLIDGFETDTQRPYVQLNLSGNLSASPKAAYFSIVCTDEEYYDDYMQVPILVYPYRYEKGSSGLLAGEVEVDSRVYFPSPANSSQFNKLHLLLPKEAPFVPTEEYMVRIMSQRGTPPYNGAKLEKVIGVEGSQFVVVNNFGITNWTGTRILFVEIFKIKDTPSSIFYEVSNRIPLVGGVPSQTSFNIYGDQYYIQNHNFTFRSDAADTPGIGFVPVVLTRTASIESPSPTFGFKSTQKVFKETKAQTFISVRNTILDYSKKDWNQGKTFVELPNPIKLNRSNVLRFSNQYLPNSSINGLSSFDSGDEYPLPVDRTSIRKLVPLGNNVLAVHERSMTTLYVEQSMIKNAEGVEQIITTDRFIGYDRELQTKIGAYHSESVVSHLGLAFGFDVFKGIAWQYSNEGISIISDFGRKNYFEKKAKAILDAGYQDCKILGGVDPTNDEYIISFIFPSEQESQNETLAFNWKKNLWTVTKYDFLADGYAKVNDELISFKNGELWVHNESATYMNFYGVQYQRRLRIAVNPSPSESKNWMALQIGTNFLTEGTDPEFVVAKAYTEDGQETLMKLDDFEKLEGVFYGPILKDVNTLPALIPAGRIALRDGDDILGKYVEIELINDHTTDPCPIHFINVSYIDSQYTM